ncbi:MAG: dipeptide epimerase [Blastocatellia bacterium]|nr:dipeptide epimerase [Blastocatellia bacterium]
MRIRELRLHRRDYKLSAPSVLAYEAIETAPNLAVSLELENGLIGWGNAAPDEHVTGETIESVERTIEDELRALVVGEDAGAIERIWANMRGRAPAHPTAVAAIDIALYDLLGKAANMPLARMLGGARAEIETTITLSIEDRETTLRRTREFLSRGFRALKIKCGLDPDEDIARVRAVRSLAGAGVRLTLDANQGYDVDTTLRVIGSLRDCGIAFIEQPVPARDLEALRELSARLPIPVMADESALDAADLLVTPAPLANLKLMKTGGITGALKANAIAEARGIRTMIGCMDESRISMAAAAHVALALHNLTFADLDGHLDIVDDLASGGLTIEDGMVRVGDAPGLGVVVT